MNAPTQDSVGFRWQVNLGVALLATLLAPLLTALGFWQLHRADEKRLLVDEYRLREQSPAISITTIDPQGDHLYRRAFARGHFINERSILLENRVRRGRPGYDLITPFVVDGTASWLWVNRGWLSASLHRSQLPSLPRLEQRVTLVGYLYQSPGKAFTLGEEHWRGQWPQVFQNLDIDKVSERLGVSSFPYQLRLERGAPGALEIGWDIVNVTPEKHTGYAIQWFTMAIATVILAVFVNSNLSAVIAARFSKTKG